MTKQLLIYDRVKPLNADEHSEWKIKSPENYGFAQDISLAPLLCAEFLQASLHYPIVFVAGEDDTPVPVVILSLESDKNNYLSQDLSWNSEYIPAFIRRYPFVFTRSKDNDEYYLCIDEAFEGVGLSVEGKSLFDEQKQPSEYTKGVLDFVSQYQLEHEKTRKICKLLHEFNLFDRKQLASKTNEMQSEEVRLSGFYTIDRSRLATLRDSSLLELVKNGSYELICNHLASLEIFKSNKFIQPSD
jgi:hypothetical protein